MTRPKRESPPNYARSRRGSRFTTLDPRCLDLVRWADAVSAVP